MYQDYRMSDREYKDAQKWIYEHECSVRDKYGNYIFDSRFLLTR